MSSLLPHQIVAVERLLRVIARYGGALLGDDVGLGKSFIAASVLARRIDAGACGVLIVPAVLQAPWRDVLEEFSLSLPVYTHDTLPNLPLAPGAWRDCLVAVDEAHRFRHREIDRSRALARLSVGAEMLLITATPVNNRSADLFALIELFAADDAFRHLGCASLQEALQSDAVPVLQSVGDAVMIRRTAADVVLPVALPSLVRRTIRYLSDETAASVLAKLDELQYPAVASEIPRGVLSEVMKRRMASSIAALRESLLRVRKFSFRAIEAGQRGLKLSKREFSRVFGSGSEEDALFQDILFGELWGLARDTVDIAAHREEISRIDELLALLAGSRDSKREAFLAALESVPKPCIVFTGAIATATDLHSAIRHSFRCAVVTGKRCLDTRGSRVTADDVFTIFQSGAIDVLVATDRASEGVNLQQAAAVVHYDLPWNPVRIDQRNGRARRLGSMRECVYVFYVLPRERAWRRVLTTLARKRRTSRAMVDVTDQADELQGVLEASGTRRGIAAKFDSGELVASLGGALVPPRLFLQQVITDGTPALNYDPARVDELREQLEAAAHMPPRLAERSPQAQLAKRLSSAGLLDRELARLLTVRYRRGIEEQLVEIAAAGSIDRAATDCLDEMLRAERRARAAAGAAVSFLLLLNPQRTD